MDESASSNRHGKRIAEKGRLALVRALDYALAADPTAVGALKIGIEAAQLAFILLPDPSEELSDKCWRMCDRALDASLAAPSADEHAAFLGIQASQLSMMLSDVAANMHGMHAVGVAAGSLEAEWIHDDLSVIPVPTREQRFAAEELQLTSSEPTGWLLEDADPSAFAMGPRGNSSEELPEGIVLCAFSKSVEAYLKLVDQHDNRHFDVVVNACHEYLEFFRNDGDDIRGIRLGLHDFDRLHAKAASWFKVECVPIDSLEGTMAMNGDLTAFTTMAERFPGLA